MEVKDLTKNFGGFRAVKQLSFTLDREEILGLVGPNGAGKTTTFNLITGFLKPTAGKIFYDGREITGLPPHGRARLGLVRTFQNTKVFAHLTVEKNIWIGCHMRERGGFKRVLLGTPHAERNDLESRVEQILTFTDLQELRDKIADDLPYGEQRALGIAIALGADPKLLLLDEPFAGMNPAEASRSMALIHKIRDAGTTVLLVDHHMDTLVKHCDRLVVMHHGEKLAEGRPKQVKEDPQVIEVYLGGTELIELRPEGKLDPDRSEQESGE